MSRLRQMHIIGSVTTVLLTTSCFDTPIASSWQPSYTQGRPGMAIQAPPPVTSTVAAPIGAAAAGGAAPAQSAPAAPGASAIPPTPAAPGLTPPPGAAPVAAPVTGAPGAPVAAAPGAVVTAAAGAAAPAPAAGAGAPPGSDMCGLPACFMTLFSRCTPMGNCSSGMINGKMAICFDNGVKLTNSFMVGTELAISGEAFNPDGSLCWSFQGMSMGNALNGALKDGTGATAATFTGDFTSMKGTITCAGEAPVQLDPSCGPPGMMAGAMMGMGMGMPMCMGTKPCM